MLEVETRDSITRERLIARRIEVGTEIAIHEAALGPLKKEELTLTRQIAKTLTESKYEPPTIPKFNPLYGRTESPIDYMPAQPHPFRDLIGSVVSRLRERIAV